jgi:hypothetical protein
MVIKMQSVTYAMVCAPNGSRVLTFVAAPQARLTLEYLIREIWGRPQI